MIPARRPAPSRLSPRLVEILARMVEAKLAAETRSLAGRRTVSSADDGIPPKERLHAR